MSRAMAAAAAFPKTLVTSGNAGLDYTWLYELMLRRGFKAVALTQKTQVLGVLWMDIILPGVHYDPLCYNVRVALKNVITRIDSVANKGMLYRNMLAAFPHVTAEHMARQSDLRDVKSVPRGETLILKPTGVGAFGGRGIAIVSNNRELAAARASITAQFKSGDVVACQYIKNPLLTRTGRKFHIRAYLALCPAGPGLPFKWAVCPVGKIMTAAKPYVNARFSDSAIHDTHLASTPRDMFFPDDLDDVLGLSKADFRVIWTQVMQLAECIAAIARPHVVPYPESMYAFGVFGIDLMITDDLNVMLLEVNHHCGFKSVSGGSAVYSAFSKRFFQWIFDEAILRVIDIVPWTEK